MHWLKKIYRKIPGAKRVFESLVLIDKSTGGRQFLFEMLPKQSVGAEIGVHLGNFSQQILDQIFPSELHLIDPWEHQTSDAYDKALYGGKAKGGQSEMEQRHRFVCKRFKKQIQAGGLVIHRGYSADVLNRFDDEYFDWIYIDGNHLYSYVKVDLELSYKKVKSGGLIMGDDYSFAGWWEGGVKKAVDEFAMIKAVEIIKFHNNQYVFRKR